MFRQFGAAQRQRQARSVEGPNQCSLTYSREPCIGVVSPDKQLDPHRFIGPAAIVLDNHAEFVATRGTCRRRDSYVDIFLSKLETQGMQQIVRHRDHAHYWPTTLKPTKGRGRKRIPTVDPLVGVSDTSEPPRTLV